MVLYITDALSALAHHFSLQRLTRFNSDSVYFISSEAMSLLPSSFQSVVYATRMWYILFTDIFFFILLLLFFLRLHISLFNTQCGCLLLFFFVCRSAILLLILLVFFMQLNNFLRRINKAHLSIYYLSFCKTRCW